MPFAVAAFGSATDLKQLIAALCFGRLSGVSGPPNVVADNLYWAYITVAALALALLAALSPFVGSNAAANQCTQATPESSCAAITWSFAEC